MGGVARTRARPAPPFTLTWVMLTLQVVIVSSSAAVGRPGFFAFSHQAQDQSHLPAIIQASLKRETSE